MSPPNSDREYGFVYTTEPKQSKFNTVLGGFVIFLFVAIWFTSIGSPVLFYLTIQHKQYLLSVLIIFLTLAAYLPWEKNDFTLRFAKFARLNLFFYKKCKYVFEKKTSLATSDHPNAATRKPIFYAVHPHGAFCLGWSMLFTSPRMLSVKFCFSPVLYISPFFRLWCRLTGNPGRADKKSMISYMKKKIDIALPPGGFEEATLTSINHDRAYIKKRLGFIKLALQHGYDVVPVYSFGENLTYWNIQGFWKFRLKLNNLGLPAILVVGNPLCPILPKRHNLGLYVACGEPLVLPTIENPSREEVKLYHDKYVAALLRLFEEHKGNFYGEEEAKTKKLELW